MPNPYSQRTSKGLDVPEAGPNIPMHLVGMSAGRDGVLSPDRFLEGFKPYVWRGLANPKAAKLMAEIIRFDKANRTQAYYARLAAKFEKAAA